MSNKFKVAFLGRGKLGYDVLAGLLKNEALDVKVIFTCSHTEEVGRSEKDFELIASNSKIPFYKTNNINRPEWVKILASLELDLAVAMAWVNTIQNAVIQTAKKGFVNLHGGALPRYRGSACQVWAILNEENEIGISVHLMDPGLLDTGPLVMQEKVKVTSKSTIKELYDIVNNRGAEMVLQTVEMIRKGESHSVMQDNDNALYCYPRLPIDGEITWTDSARKIEKLVRAAGDPYPGAYSYFTDRRDDQKIKKMIIRSAQIEEPGFDFCAVPGHLLKLDNGERWAVVCGDYKLLVLKKIEVDGKIVKPNNFFRTVRQRFGLDVQGYIYRLEKRIEELEDRLDKIN